jgi:hypothetical protein
MRITIKFHNFYAAMLFGADFMFIIYTYIFGININIHNINFLKTSKQHEANNAENKH